MKIDHLDHLVMTVQNINKTCEFYSRALNLRIETFRENRKALHFGSQKINLHQLHHEFEPKAKIPTPGSLDLCLIAKTPLNEVIVHLNKLNIPIEIGPIERTGAQGRIQSVYIRDPDQNLIELANYISR